MCVIIGNRDVAWNHYMYNTLGTRHLDQGEDIGRAVAVEKGQSRFVSATSTTGRGKIAGVHTRCIQTGTKVCSRAQVENGRQHCTSAEWILPCFSVLAVWSRYNTFKMTEGEHNLRGENHGDRLCQLESVWVAVVESANQEMYLNLDICSARPREGTCSTRVACPEGGRSRCDIG